MRKKIWLYLLLGVLYIAPYIAFFLYIGKGDINGQLYNENTSDNATVVVDTTCANAPTASSERYLGVDTIQLERADKRADKCGKTNDFIDADGTFLPQQHDASNLLANESVPENEVLGTLEDGYVPENADSGTLVASYGQVTDDVKEDYFPMINSCDTNNMVEVLLPRVQRKYEDSTYTVWVSGYDPIVDSVLVYNKRVYYPIVEEREAKPPPVVVTIGPYMGYGNKGFNYGIALTVGFPIELKKVIRRL